MESKDSIGPGDPANAIANARVPGLLFRNRGQRLFWEARKGWFRYESYPVLSCPSPCPVRVLLLDHVLVSRTLKPPIVQSDVPFHI